MDKNGAAEESVKKHIVLVDNELKIIEHVIEETDWIVECLITINSKNKYSDNPRIKKIYAESDFLNNKCLKGFDYYDLNHLWHAQLRMENCFNRFLADYQIAKWNF